MSKKYIMFVNESGFVNMNTSKNITLFGIIFEQDYCVTSKNKVSDLSKKLKAYKERIFINCRNLLFDDAFFYDNRNKNMNIGDKKKFISELPEFVKNLKFTIITCTVRHECNELLETYALATKRLLKEYYAFILRKNADAGEIIMEAKSDKTSYKMQQSFFDIYTERSLNQNLTNNIQDKINGFIVCEKNSKIYGCIIELSNVLNYIVHRVYSGEREIERKFISCMEYGNKNKIFDSIKHKIWKYTKIETFFNHNNIEKINLELSALKEQCLLKDIKITEKEKEIKELTNEIKFLSQQVKKMLKNREDDSLISRIFLDIDVKMKRAERLSAAAADN